ncbi:MAG: hypothetical protein HUU15_17165, partial [Candidatus Brocadiae bacterium]|nr:hypothetical protein [Candidatus Brocadiia bacterium]
MRVYLEGGTAGFAACVRGALTAAGHAETPDPGCADGAILLDGAGDGTLEEMAALLVGR